MNTFNIENIENLEANLNANFVAEKEASWKVEVEGKVSESLLKKIQSWYDADCDTDVEFEDEYVNEVAHFADDEAQVIIRYSHK